MTSSAPIKVLIVTVPCNGLGDVVFAYKVAWYLKEWYKGRVQTRFAGDVDKFVQLGVPRKHVVPIMGSGPTACDDVHRHKVTPSPEALQGFDVYLVAPLVIGLEPSFRNVHKLIPDSNPDNTYFMSEYNAPLNGRVRFQTGVGHDRVGLLFLPRGPASLTRRPASVKSHPYVITYMNQDDETPWTCYNAFLGMVTTEYLTLRSKRLDVVASPWLAPHLGKHMKETLRAIDPQFRTVSIVVKDRGPPQTFENPHADADADRHLCFRLDVLPLPFKSMGGLYAHCLPHALLTGDHSITDFLGARKPSQPSYPFYQPMSWKKNLYVTLAREMPHRFLGTKKTSCGSLEAVGYHPDLSAFIRENDFRKLARPLMDAVIRKAITLRKTGNRKI